MPFGENPKSSKKSLYQIEDLSLLFYYSAVTKHRSKWPNYSKKQKMEILHTHCQKAFEIYIRQNIASSQRYWFKDQLEFDVIRETPGKKNNLDIIECKWSRLTKVQKDSIKQKIRNKYNQSPLYKNSLELNISVCDQSNFYEFLKR